MPCQTATLVHCVPIMQHLLLSHSNIVMPLINIMPAVPER